MSKKKKIIISISSTIAIVVLLVVLYLVYAFNQIGSIPETTSSADATASGDYAADESGDIEWDTVENLADTEGVYNILLCGEENQHGSSDQNGRTDSMMIVSINMNSNTISVLSLMRDMYVHIDDYGNNKLNVAYRVGGSKLLTETVEKNFGVDIDGFVSVNFDNFESLIDLLGGVEIKLTPDEVSYMQMKGVIDESIDPDEFASTTQNLTGAQALWYSRIRYVKTDNGLRDDYGRTYRQRTVFKKIYEKYKDSSYLTMMSMLPKVLGMIKTDMTKAEIIRLGCDVISLKGAKLQMTSVPFKDCYYGTQIYGMSVLYLSDIDEIRIKIQKIIEGEDVDTVLSTYYDTTGLYDDDEKYAHYNSSSSTTTSSGDAAAQAAAAAQAQAAAQAAAAAQAQAQADTTAQAAAQAAAQAQAEAAAQAQAEAAAQAQAEAAAAQAQ